ncbi:GNAT family N-acetyltransferase [Streptomyces olivaceoviridis]|uniref:GNAT family N-acetyltransferase n=1 Tax=Streptomyces olivaceoviridis TaxID=1921 RepID=UPI00367CB557
MSARVQDHREESRFEIFEKDELAGFTEYHRFHDEIAFLHTAIGERFAGRGLGQVLARGALLAAKEQHLKVLPYCPFIRAYIAKHPDDFLTLVPEAHRARFAL